MKNKTITIYELMGLIKDNKAPKKIKFQDVIYEYDKNINGYFDKNGYNLFYLVMSKYILDSKIEILTEENDEWEDIEEYQYSIIPSYFNLESAIKTINENFEKHQKALISIVKNQKYIIEKLESKDDL